MFSDWVVGQTGWVILRNGSVARVTKTNNTSKWVVAVEVLVNQGSTDARVMGYVQTEDGKHSVDSASDLDSVEFAPSECRDFFFSPSDVISDETPFADLSREIFGECDDYEPKCPACKAGIISKFLDKMASRDSVDISQFTLNLYPDLDASDAEENDQE